MTDQPATYDSRAVTTEEWPIVSWWYYEHGPVWECLPPREGIIYLRRHISGPVNTTSAGWMPA